MLSYPRLLFSKHQSGRYLDLVLYSEPEAIAMRINIGGDKPPYFTFSETLEELGLYVDIEGRVSDGSLPRGNIRIPEELKRNHARLSAFWEAVHGAVRAEIIHKLKQCGLVEFYLPQKTLIRPENERFVTIMITEPSMLKKKKHVIVVANNVWNDLGALSYDFIIGKRQGIYNGSLLCFAQELFEHDESAPGLVILNMGQLIWSTVRGNTINEDSWVTQNYTAFGLDRPRRIYEHIELNRPRHRRDPSDQLITELRVRDNGSVKSHLKCAVDFVTTSEHVRVDARISILAIGNEAGGEIGRSLQSRHDRFDLGWWFPRLGAVAWAGQENPYQESIEKDNTYFERDIAEFMCWRTAAWVSSEEARGAPLNDFDDATEVSKEGLFNIMQWSSGVPGDDEAVLSQCYFNILTYLCYKTKEEIDRLAWVDAGFLKRGTLGTTVTQGL